MTNLQDRVALEVFAKYEALPAKSKPGIDNNGKRQWVPLSGIVMSDEDSTELRCVAIATGMKCLPLSKIGKSQGHVLHDWHAEILAIRLFNDFLIQEIRKTHLTDQEQSLYIRKRNDDELSVARGLQPFTIKESMRIHMYCSEAPCGDASMELIMNAQEDSTPWPVLEPGLEQDNINVNSLKGRGSFSELGIVRRKPARADSPPTLSKSCSDKIALKQCTSLLSSPTSLLVSPENAYISSLVLPATQHVPEACQRAFSEEGRLHSLKGKIWPGGYAFRPLSVLPTVHEFSHSKRTSGPKSSNVSAAWNLYTNETLINGVLQGRKQSDPRGSSRISRYKAWHSVASVLSALAMPALNEILSAKSYSTVKGSDLLSARTAVKEAKESSLRGWVQNLRDDFDIGE